MTPEGKIKTMVKKLLAENDVWYFMPAANGYGKSGIPDFVCIVAGIFVGVECKADATKKPTALQLRRADEIQDAGGLWMLVYDKDSANALLNVIQYVREARLVELEYVSS